MEHVDKYIRKLLFEHDCVIIPDFGGLLTHHTGVGYDALREIFHPASKRLAFNEILKIDDGLLVYYISSGEQITRDEASEIVGRYVDNLKAEISESKTASIRAVGEFSFNSEGKLVFEPDYSQNYNQEWYGLDQLPAKLCDSKTSWLGQEPPQSAELTLSQAEEHPIQPLATKRVVRWGWAAAAVVVGLASAFSVLYRPANHGMLSSLDPVSLVSGLYTPMSSASIDTDAGIWGPTVEKVNLSQGVNAELYKPLSGTISVVASEIPVEDKTEEKPSAENHIDDNFANYFLIAGSFKSQKNARQLKTQLLAKGLTDVRILDNTDGKWIKVSAGAYPTHSEALKDKKKVDDLTQAESWVFHQK